ncbi:MAG: LacI family DNA-binding transcriptional regulator [Bifidobacteriaceae bacterium]|nr:LacI family DNA-binding transcriptional regulator [Bifidobacteriaceae bacterium]
MARAAGVSVPTVSKVLNDRAGVAETTRRAVLRAAHDAGYVKRHRASGRKTGVVDFLIAGYDTQWAFSLLRGAFEGGEMLGVDVAVHRATQGEQWDTAWLHRVAARGSDGIVLVATELTPAARAEAVRRQLPIVLIDPIGPGDSSVPTVATANWAGSRDATEHLIELGHRRIGIITGPIGETTMADRLDGFGAAMRRHNLQPEPSLIRYGNSLVHGGIEHGGALLDLPERPTAIFSFSDEQASGVYEAARMRGLTIPDDVSVVGFDDVPLCQWVSPQLTTVRQPLVEMGREATRIVADLAQGRALAAPRIELATALVVRASTGPAPQPTRT